MRGLKRIFSALGLAGLLGLALLLFAFPSRAAASCPDGLTAYWRLEETSGSSFADAAGGLNAACSGSCPVAVTGKIGNGRQFASSALEAAGSNFDWGATSSFSIEYWLWKAPGTSVGDESVVGRAATGGMRWWTGVWANGKAAFVLISTNGEGSAPADFLQGDTSLADGRWHHLVAVRDGSRGENRLYVDGSLVDLKPITYSGGFSAPAGTPLRIGGTAGGYFSGTADEVAIYQRALTEQEIGYHYYLVREYCSSCEVPVKIMPLGDSITTGSSSGVEDPAYQVSYRKDLWERLIEEGYHIDFVGSQVTGQGYSSEGFDPDNEGHPGWGNLSLANYAYSWVSASQPDVVLLHAGTNGVNPDTTDLERLLREIDRYSEDTTVILARIINRLPYDQTTTAYNDNLEAMARTRLAAGDKIILVDMEDGAGLVYQYQPAGDFYNYLHPYATGYTKMAGMWHAALTTFLPRCPSAYPPSITSTPPLTAHAGSPYSYDVQASGSPAPTYALITSPTGMKIDKGTGLISWTPSAGGSFAVTVEARNTSGVDRQSFTVHALTDQSIATGLLALYHFDQTSGENGQLVLDFSAYSNNATCQSLSGGCPAWTSGGRFGGAFRYDGTDDCFVVPDSPLWDLTDFTISAWVNIRAYTGSEMHIWGHRGAANSSRALWLYINSNGNGVSFKRNDRDVAASTFSLPTGEWHHLAVTYRAATGEAALYIDGDLVDTGVQTGSLYGTDNVMDLGFRTAKNDNPFDGMIDEVALWGRSLTADEISQAASQPVGIEPQACTNGATRSCYTGPAGSAGVGICQAGEETCLDGHWGPCAGEVLPQAETCGDGLDNDCSGQADDGALCCASGSTKPCGSDTGACQAGTQTCERGVWSVCQGSVGPQPEICGDSIDQDCDGTDTPCSGTTTPTGLLALYHFDLTTGETEQFVYDFSGQGNDATCEPSAGECPAWSQAGRFGGAFSYDGLDDRFTVPDSPLWELQDLTVSAWVNIRRYTGSEMHIWGHRGATSSSRALWLYINSNGNRLSFKRNDRDVVTAAFSLPVGEWHHLAVTYQAASGQTMLYIDGLPADNGVQTGSLYTTDNVMDLGFRTAKNDNPFDGMIDEVAIWNEALTAQEVLDLSSQPTGPALEECTAGQTRPCYDGAAETEEVGLCRSGLQNCTGGQWGPCENQVLPVEDICGDGLDNDCNGQADDGALCCASGDTRPCGSDTGACQSGVQTCESGVWSVCQGSIGPQPEICGDSIDQDCDGTDTPCSGTTIPTGLLALYHFDLTAGENEEYVFDFSGQGNDATCEAAAGECPAWTPAGKFGGAFGYDGVNDRFIVPDSRLWEVEDFTISAWVNIRRYTGSEMHVWGHRGATTSSRALWLFINSNGNRMTFKRNNLDVVATPSSLPTGQWHHVAVTYSAATGQTTLYIDGELVDKAIQTGSLYPTDNVVDLGFRTAKNDNPFDGLIDELAIWNQALTADEIREVALGRFP